MDTAVKPQYNIVKAQKIFSSGNILERSINAVGSRPGQVFKAQGPQS